MNLHSNTILITGGGAGIGRGLAEAFGKLGNQVIVTGRREEKLHNLCAAHPGMKYAVSDVADPASIRSLAEKVAKEFPSLNCLINNAGVQTRDSDFSANSFDDEAMNREIQTNFTGLIRMCSAFTPLLKGKAGATLINVSSGLAFVPLARFPVYCATKAAVHSFSLSLRRQLRDSGIQVVELVPPWVKTGLGGQPEVPASAPVQPMSLADFTQRAMEGLSGGADEVIVGDAVGLADAGGLESAKKPFARMNG